MFDVAGMPAVLVENRPWVHYKVVTAHGSELDVYWRHTVNILSPDNHGIIRDQAGDTYVEGHSVSTGKHIRLAGIGSEPKVDGRVAVGSLGRRTDNTDILIEELITKIVSTQEVGTTPI